MGFCSAKGAPREYHGQYIQNEGKNIDCNKSNILARDVESMQIIFIKTNTDITDLLK